MLAVIIEFHNGAKQPTKNQARRKGRKEVPIPLTKAIKKGREVWVSEIAERGRKLGCLCVHEENGQRVMCRRLKNNLEIQNSAESEQIAELTLKINAIDAFLKMLTKDPFANLSNSDPCPIALVAFELCKAGNVAFATSRCPGYLPPEATTAASEPVGEKAGSIDTDTDVVKDAWKAAAKEELSDS